MEQNKIIIEPLEYDEEKIYAYNEIEKARHIPQNQLNNAKLFSSRYDYANTLNKNIAYLEVGVGWGHSAQMFIDATNAESADLVDLYKGAPGIMFSGGSKPENAYITHEEHIKNKFSYHRNINTIKGNARDIIPLLNKKYDFIFLDMEGERFLIRKLLSYCSKLINDDGIIGLTSYTNHSLIYEKNTGVYQSVNEFLYFNNNWSVDALVFNELALNDIYIKNNKMA